MHSIETAEQLISNIYGLSLTKIISFKRVSKIKSKNYGTFLITYVSDKSSEKQKKAYIHFATQSVKWMQIEDLRQFCLPVQMFACKKGLQAPKIWKTTAKDTIWEWEKYHGFIEDQIYGQTKKEFTDADLNVFGKWIGKWHTESMNLNLEYKRTVYLCLNRIHERWSDVVIPIIKNRPFDAEDNRGEIIKFLSKKSGLYNKIDQIIRELKKRINKLKTEQFLAIHGDLGPDNIIWKSEGEKINGVIDWKGSRHDARIVDLLYPLRKIIIGEGGTKNGVDQKKIAAFYGGYCEHALPLSPEEIQLLIPALIALDISFIVWQLRQPIYIERALSRLKDFEFLFHQRRMIEDLF